MKFKYLFVFVFLFIVINTLAQSPEQFSYQAVLRNPSGDVLSNQAVGMQVIIRQGSATGAAV